MTEVLDGLRALGTARLVALAAVALGTLGLIGVLALAPVQPPMALLYAQLAPADTARVAAALDRLGIRHRSNALGDQLLVPQGQVAAARIALARQGLPAHGSVGYEIFDRSNGLIADSFRQHVDLLRALEGELGRTIGAINGIGGARVQLVLPRRSPFAAAPAPATASVLITPNAGARIDSETVSAIVNLVAAAVPGLRPRAITVVDDRGTLLARARNGAGSTVGLRGGAALRHAFESHLASAVQAMLDRVLGQGAARAHASVSMNFDHTRQTQESFDPNGQVVRSTATSSDVSATHSPTPSVSVANNLPNAQATGAGALSTDKRQRDTTNYEISKTVRTLVHRQPQVARISLAVVVDGMPGVPAAQWKPLPAAQMASLTALVKAAIGFDAKRGDLVAIVNHRLSVPPHSVRPQPGTIARLLRSADLPALLRATGPALIGLLALLLVVRPMVRRLLLVAPAEMPGRAPTLLAGSAVAASEEGEFARMPGMEAPLPLSSLRRLTELAERNPVETVAIVRGWIEGGT